MKSLHMYNYSPLTTNHAQEMSVSENFKKTLAYFSSDLHILTCEERDNLKNL